MTGDGDVLAVGCGGQLQHAAELPRGQRADLAAGGADLQGVLAGGVGDPHGLAVGVEHARQPYADAGLGAQHARGAVAVGHPVGRAADLDGAGPAGGVRRVRAHPQRRGPLGAPGPGTAEPHVQLVRLGVQALQQPQVTGVRVDHPLPVAGGVAGVELFV
ncbi:hypothetical protein WBK31_04045 [Nonomuraea sp. N2-4H]|uniref:hypothetical protein n=1 Tax=Nonomuraea sp. N2-4H TaxID=3128898 RepID=UPI00324B623F